MTFKGRRESFITDVLGWVTSLAVLAMALVALVLFIYAMSCGGSDGPVDPL